MAGARKLVATEEFDILGGTERELAARRKQQQEDEERGSGLGFLGTSLADMFGPPKDSVGVRLLRKMGWRPGQGIGPRMKRRLSDSDDDDDAFGQDITFAPRDTPIENFQAKRDTYGLGYDLSASVPEVAEMKRLRELARQKAMDTNTKNRASFGVVDTSGRKTEAFGLGAYEVDDEDEDVYRNESSMSNYHSALYDDNEGGLTRDELKRQSMKRKRQQEEDVASKSALKCSDGRPPLKGFHVSDQRQEIGRWHAPPKIPADYTGQHIIAVDTSTPKATTINKESIFSFEERGNVLGEKPIEQRSVFDYMPKHSKDKLDQAVNWFIDSGKDKSQLSDFPTVAKDVAQLALKGFMPFGDQLQKQARYRNYLENQAGLLSEDGVPKKVLPIPEGLTYEAGMKEMDEFAKAARIFRPISAMMSGRFTSASESKHVEVVNFEGGLKTEEQYRKEKEQKAKEAVEPEKKKEVYTNAAYMEQRY
jgi:G patch domain-containing protein 1